MIWRLSQDRLNRFFLEQTQYMSLSDKDSLVVIDYSHLCVVEDVDDDRLEDGIYDFYAVEEQAAISHKQEPSYPELAKKSGMEGIVMVEVVISTEGVVISAVVVGARPKGVEGYFEEAAIDAVLQYKFLPAKEKGVAVAVRRRIPIEFKLE